MVSFMERSADHTSAFFDETSPNSINEAIYNIETGQYELTTENRYAQG